MSGIEFTSDRELLMEREAVSSPGRMNVGRENPRFSGFRSEFILMKCVWDKRHVASPFDGLSHFALLLGG